MTLILLYLVVLILVAIVLFGVASLVFGRGEQLPPLPARDDGDGAARVRRDGRRRRRRQVHPALRGYKTSEVDWVLDRLGPELDQLRGELATVRRRARRRRAAEEAPAGGGAHAACPGRSGFVTTTPRTTAASAAVGTDHAGRSRFRLYRDYHDKEWGQPLRGPIALFERMSLEAFQSGLSWLIILRKRENFRRAFDRVRHRQGRAIHRLATSTRLLADAGIVRNRAKIEATIANARAVADLDVDLSDLLWSFAPPRRPRPDGLVGGAGDDPGIQGDGQGPQTSRLRVRRPHHRLRVDAGHRDGRRSRRVVLGARGGVIRTLGDLTGLCTPTAADREQ